MPCGSKLEREVPPRYSATVPLGMAVLAVTFGELMTGGILATPFSLLGVFLVPPFVVVSLTYGFGVLLVREASTRCRGGWASTILLAATNAWVLQGVFTKVLFGPAASPDILQFGSYGHGVGVNWVLVAVALYLDGVLATIFPIFLTNELFPRTRGRRLLSDRGVLIALAAFAPLLAWEDIYINANNNIGPSAAHPFVSSLTPPDLAILISVVVGLSLLAWKLPKGILRPRTRLPVGSAWAFLGVGVAFTLSAPFIEGFAWQLIPWPAALLEGYAVESALLVLVVLRRIGSFGNLPHRVALIAGCLLPWVFLDVILEISGDLLVLPIAAGVLCLLAMLWRRGAIENRTVVEGAMGGAATG
ncbi:MAG: hypothetical protein L3K03_08295 [Thermoplasmata archaeon]|nr:hypothetical protein [Thermoplasmata archaeon]